jgi:putative spermidine/putrescine transport system substrate-binding protein
MDDAKASSSSLLGRRTLLAASGAALAMPAIRPSWAAERSLTVSTYGGAFEDSFREHVHPAFTKATGIKVVSQPEAEGAQFLIQLAMANKGGVAPMDLCLSNEEDVLRGRAQGVWRPFDVGKIPNLSAVLPPYVMSGPAGVDGIGGLAWFMTLVVNPDEVKPKPDSWTVLWAPGRKRWGLSGGGTSPLFEIAAALYFGGTEALDTHEGIDKVGEKLAELKGQTKMWWTDEGTMQTALQNDEVAGGTYYHDVAGTMAKAGTTIVSIFPKEGAFSGTGIWCQPTSSTKIEEAQEFINFIATPQAQELIARHVGSAPVIARDKLDLTPAEFALVSDEATPIRINAPSRVKYSDYYEQVFTRMVTAG